MRFQGLGGRLQDEHQRGDLHVQLLLLGQHVLLFAERFQIRGIGFVELGDMGDHGPVAVQGRTGDLLDPGQFQLFDRAELAEINLGPGHDAHAVASALACSRGGLGTLDRILHVSLHVFFDDAALATGSFHLGQVDAELARQTAYRRGSVDIGVVGDEIGSGSSLGNRRRGGGSRSGSNRSRGGSRCSHGSRSCTSDFEHHDERSGGDLVTRLHLDLLDHTGERRRDFHGGLVTFHGDQGLVGFDLVTHGHHDLGDFHFVTADVRYVDLFGSGGNRGSGHGSGSLNRRGNGSRGGASHFEHHHQGTGGDLGAGGDLDFHHAARERRRHFHGGLVTFHGDDGLVRFNHVAHGDHDLGHFHFVVTYVRDVHVFGSGSSRSSRRSGGNRGRGLGRSRCGSTFGFEDHDLGTGGNLVAHLDQDLFDDAGGGGRDFHGGLVTFHGDQGLVELDLVTHGHHDLGDFNLIGTDIRHHNLFGHCALSSYADVTLTLEKRAATAIALAGERLHPLIRWSRQAG